MASLNSFPEPEKRIHGVLWASEKEMGELEQKGRATLTDRAMLGGTQIGEQIALQADNGDEKMVVKILQMNPTPGNTRGHQDVIVELVSKLGE